MFLLDYDELCLQLERSSGSMQQLAASSSCGLAAHSAQVSWDPAKPLLLDGLLLLTAGRCQAIRAKSLLLIADCQLLLQ